MGYRCCEFMRIGCFVGLQRFVCMHEGGADVGFIRFGGRRVVV